MARPYLYMNPTKYRKREATDQARPRPQLTFDSAEAPLWKCQICGEYIPEGEGWIQCARHPKYEMHYRNWKKREEEKRLIQKQQCVQKKTKHEN